MSEKQIDIPVMEIFGPVIQGEGFMCGKSTFFVRLGGCDYRCVWCDTKYAVTPSEVSKNATRMTHEQILYKLMELGCTGGDNITLSGGNPAMHDMEPFVDLCISNNFSITIETQGTLFRPWLQKVDYVSVSPKPPSSGHQVSFTSFKTWLDKLYSSEDIPLHLGIKLVTFDAFDVDWAINFLNSAVTWIEEGWSAPWDRDVSLFIQPGSGRVGNYNEEGMSIDEMRQSIADSYDMVAQRILRQDELRQVVRVIPQVHTLIYGDVRGV